MGKSLMDLLDNTDLSARSPGRAKGIRNKCYAIYYRLPYLRYTYLDISKESVGVVYKGKVREILLSDLDAYSCSLGERYRDCLETVSKSLGFSSIRVAEKHCPEYLETIGNLLYDNPSIVLLHINRKNKEYTYLQNGVQKKGSL